VGYGDIFPLTFPGKVLTILLVPLCIVLFTYFMGRIVGAIVEFNVSPLKRSKKMEKKIKRLNKHVILCGLGPMTNTIIEKMQQEKRDFVLIEPDESKVEAFINDYNIVIGDPCEDTVLRRAGIDKAEGLITTRTDAENVLVVLSAREMNPGLIITSSAERLESESKLRKAGADRVINPERIGGTRMALSVLKPAAVDYMDRVFTSDSENFRIEELFISESSNLIDKTVKSAEIGNRYDISVLAIKRGSSIVTAKLADLALQANDTMIVFGKDENIENFKALTRSDRI
jgi:voltage-gated potassium channel